MAILKWGWLLQKKTNSSIKLSGWKKRYLVLTTNSIHIHKSERGVISPSYRNQGYKSFGWSYFQDVKRQGTHTFLVESRNPQLYASLQFQSKNEQERNSWLQAIYEQLRLTLKRWFHHSPTIPHRTTTTVLDKWLDHCNVRDQSFISSSSYEPTIEPKRRRLLFKLIPLF